MKQIRPDLWETAPDSPFPGLTTHAYLLVRKGGNVLFYNTAQPKAIEALAAAGGVACHYLSHRDEMGESLRWIRERYGARLGCHRLEESDCARFCNPDILFDRRQVISEGVEVIPTPGHSPGSTCFLVSVAAGERYLFTGDTLYFDAEDQWRAGFIPGVTDPGQIGVLRQSLGVLRQLAPDLVLSSAYGGLAGYQEMDPGDWPGYVDRALALLRQEEARAPGSKP